MMSDDFLKIDFRFYEIRYELWTLADYIKTLEWQLPLIGEHEVDRTWQNLRDNKLDDDEGERSIAFQEVTDLVENVVPRFFRGPIIISLWAIYQSAAEDIAEYIRKQKGCALTPRDIYANSDYDRIKKYYSLVLDFPLIVDQKVEDRLRIVIALRNILAHSNGRLTAFNENKRKEIQHMEKFGITISQTECLSFSEIFVRESFDLLAGSLRDLIDRVLAEFPKGKV